MWKSLWEWQLSQSPRAYVTHVCFWWNFSVTKHIFCSHVLHVLYYSFKVVVIHEHCETTVLLRVHFKDIILWQVFTYLANKYRTAWRQHRMRFVQIPFLRNFDLNANLNKKETFTSLLFHEYKETNFNFLAFDFILLFRSLQIYLRMWMVTGAHWCDTETLNMRKIIKVDV